MKEGYHVDVDDSSKTLQKKIRENQLAQVKPLPLAGRADVARAVQLHPGGGQGGDRVQDCQRAHPRQRRSRYYCRGT
eukprot:338596-Hanusia_phi.AAC.3